LPENESYLLGTWIVIATVNLGELTAQGNLTFRVGWIVEILSIETLQDDQPQTIFHLNQTLKIKILLRSIALTPKKL